MTTATITVRGTARATAPGTARGEDGWLTTTLRPAGTLDRPTLRRLSESLGHLASCSDMVIIDLSATDVGDPRVFARELLAPALAFAASGQCLLLTGASARLAAELDRAAVPVITLAADPPKTLGSAKTFVRPGAQDPS